MTSKKQDLILDWTKYLFRKCILPDERVEKAEDQHNPPITIHLISKSDSLFLKKHCFQKSATLYALFLSQTHKAIFQVWKISSNKNLKRLKGKWRNSDTFKQSNMSKHINAEFHFNSDPPSRQPLSIQNTWRNTQKYWLKLLLSIETFESLLHTVLY